MTRPRPHISAGLLLLASTLSACELTQAPLPEPVIVPNDIYASRDFAGPGDFPPQDFKGYGMLAFPAKPTAARGRMFCAAYVEGFTSVEAFVAAGVETEQQMVTVWPLNDAALAAELRVSEASTADICEKAVPNYGLSIADITLTDARKADPRGTGVGALDGRGPYLLAWSPAAQKGKRDVLVLVSDMSDVSSAAQARAEMLRWKNEIVDRPELWSEGWSQERVRVTIQRWADRNARSILSFLGIEA